MISLVEYLVEVYSRFVVFVFMVVMSNIFKSGFEHMRNVHMVVDIDVQIVMVKILAVVSLNVLSENPYLLFGKNPAKENGQLAIEPVSGCFSRFEQFLPR